MNHPLSEHLTKQSDRIKDEALELLRDLQLSIETGRITVTDSDLTVWDPLAEGRYQLQFKYREDF